MDTNEHWFLDKIIECSNCHLKLRIVEHSPFEIGYYLYCNSCPKRTDVSIYDARYEKLESILRKRFPDLFEWDKHVEILLGKIADMLKPCSCGGKFDKKSPRRCLHCNTILDDYDNGVNVWLVDTFEDDAADARMKNFIVEPKWKKLHDS